MRPVDVSIVGGGIFGLCAAWSCHQRGLSVRVFEAATLGAGASGGVVGALSPHMPDNWNPKKAFQFKALSQARSFWRSVEDVSGIDPGYRRVGRIIPLRSERALQLARSRIAEAGRNWDGTASFEVLERSGEVTGPFGVVHETLSAKLYPKLAIQSLGAALRRLGVQIVETAPVAPGKIEASRLTVVAAGHQSGQPAPALDGLVRGVKGQAALLSHVMPAGQPVLFDDGLYIIGHERHGTAVGSTSENSWTTDGTDEQLDALLARARNVLPALSAAPVLERWSGIRPRGPKPDPLLGQIDADTWVFTGGFKIGFGIAHALAETLADGLTGCPMDVPESFLLKSHLRGDR